MKTIFKIILSVFVLTGSLFGQEDGPPQPTGFIRLVNGVSQGSGQVYLSINGEDIRPSGYKLGDATGGIGLRPGSHKVSIKRDGVREGVTTVVLAKDQTVTLIPFAEKVPASDEEPAYFKIQILRLKQKDVDSGRVATFVSVSANPELKVEVQAEDGKWSSSFVKRLSVTELPLNFTQGYAPARVAGNPIKPIPIGGSGNYVLVLYDDPEEKVQSLYFRDFKFLSAD
jgi:hypothetical protein